MAVIHLFIITACLYEIQRYFVSCIKYKEVAPAMEATSFGVVIVA